MYNIVDDLPAWDKHLASDLASNLNCPIGQLATISADCQKTYCPLESVQTRAAYRISKSLDTW